MNPVAVLHHVVDRNRKPLGDSLWFWCPGCDKAHRVNVKDAQGRAESPAWGWDGNLEKPTISPSILVSMSVHLCEGEHEPRVCPNPESCGSPSHLILSEGPRVLGHGTPHTREPAYGSCHSLVKGGQWEFLSDCSHRLAGQTVPMVPIPDWMVRT